ncbi:hypothetical protein [Corallococcus sp. Z5C101001]|uniref:hypothetical protein n=1 Tax=Corallococcus sp. Z5C101001 TaxID=2596829 RepID=UPI00163D6BB2|nr:hypothetical protein [Corallococcus sp. Z5C101001]
MSTPEPVRLLEETSDASSDLRGLLRSAVEDEPTADQLASLAARLGPLPAPPTPGPPSAPPAADAVSAAVSSGLKLKVLVGMAVLTGTVGSFHVGRVYERTHADAERPLTRDIAPAPAAPLPSEEPAPPAPEAEPSAPPAPVAPPTAGVPPTGPAPRPTSAAPKRPPAPAPSVAPAAEDEELLLLDSAHQALRRGDSERALASAQAHASRFPAGTLAQEREVIAIEALVRLGRVPEARERAEAFGARYPTSSHLVRLQGLLHPSGP